MTRIRTRSLPRLTRRRVLAVAATVGAGAAAASVAGLSSAKENGSGSGSSALVVSLRDARSGTFDLFVGDSRMVFKDKDLANRLVETVKRG